MQDAIKSSKLDQIGSLARNSDINKAEHYVEEYCSYLTPLQLAIHHNQLRAVNCLLALGARVNSPSVVASSFWGAVAYTLTLSLYSLYIPMTALHIAGKVDNEQIIETLLSHGAEYASADKKGYLPLTLPQLCNNIPSCDLLTVLDIRGYTPGNSGAAISAESVTLLGVGLRNSMVSTVLLNLGKIALNTDDDTFVSNMALIQALIVALKAGPRVSNIELNGNFSIETNTDVTMAGLIFGESQESEKDKRLICQRVGSFLEIMLGFSTIPLLREFELGEMYIHNTEKYSETKKENQYKYVRTSRGYSHQWVECDVKEEKERDNRVDIIKLGKSDLQKVLNEKEETRAFIKAMNDERFNRWKKSIIVLPLTKLAYKLVGSEYHRETTIALDDTAIVDFCSNFMANLDHSTSGPANPAMTHAST